VWIYGSLSIILAKQRTYLPEMLVVILFFVCSEKALRVMDQTLRARSHHDLLNNFSKKNFGEISEN
jgi:hypothetical protein